MTYADPMLCIDCRTPLPPGATRCPNCGLDLQNPDLQQVWQALVSADAWLAHARSATPAAPTAPPETVPEATAALSSTAPPPMAPPVHTPQRLTMEAVVLGLGALCVMAAGTIFVAIQWGDLGIAARALILFAATVLAGVAAAFVTQRGLRSSAEALWAVFLVLFTLDWFASREENLFGLDSVSSYLWAFLWAVATFAMTTVIVRIGRRSLDGVELAAASVFGGFTTLVAGLSAAGTVAEYTEWGTAWEAFAGLVVAWAFAAAQLVPPFKVGRWIAVAVTVGFGIVFTIAAVFRLIDNPEFGDLIRGDGWPLVVAAAASVAAGVRLPRLRALFIVIGGLELLLLILVPIEHEWPGVGGYVVAAMALVLGAAIRESEGGWKLAVRIGTIVTAAGLLLATTPWYVAAIEQLGRALSGDEGRSLDPDRWGIPLLVGGATAAALVLARRWSGFGNPGSAALPAALGVAALHVMVSAAVAIETLEIEAYTAPFAVTALAIGTYAMRRNPSLRSVPVLGLGVVLALLPSLPGALADPTSLRALLLGIAAAAFLAVGVVKRWQAPFVGGAVVLAIVAFAEIWPSVSEVPSWALLSAVGVLLLVAGATWEDRVRQGRAAVQYVSSMR